MAQRRDAGATFDIGAVGGTAGIDEAGAGLLPLCRRVEEYVEDAAGAAELQLAGIALPHVEPGLAELTDERGCAGADNPLDARQGLYYRRRRIESLRPWTADLPPAVRRAGYGGLTSAVYLATTGAAARSEHQGQPA